MTRYRLTNIEMLDGLVIFMGWGGNGVVKKSYVKIRDPSITFDRNVMEGCCYRINDWARVDLSWELYRPS